MNYKHACVVDAAYHYKTLVLVLLEPDENGQVQENIQHYVLQEGEALVDAAPPTTRPHAGTPGFVHPRWDGTAWVEGATPEEITTWELEHPAPEVMPSSPTAEDDAAALLVDHEYRLTLMELGVN